MAGDENPADALLSAIDRPLKLHIMRLFVGSPDAVDCSEGIGPRIGYHGANLVGAPTELAEVDVSESIGVGLLPCTGRIDRSRFEGASSG